MVLFYNASLRITHILRYKMKNHDCAVLCEYIVRPGFCPELNGCDSGGPESSELIELVGAGVSLGVEVSFVGEREGDDLGAAGFGSTCIASSSGFEEEFDCDCKGSTEDDAEGNGRDECPLRA